MKKKCFIAIMILCLLTVLLTACTDTANEDTGPGGALPVPNTGAQQAVPSPSDPGAVNSNAPGGSDPVESGQPVQPGGEAAPSAGAESSPPVTTEEPEEPIESAFVIDIGENSAIGGN